MVLKDLFSGGKVEQKAIESIRKHIKTLGAACQTFKEAFKKRNADLMSTVADLERDGDSTRREIIAHIYEGAFLPFMRPSICRFVEIVDDAFDVLEDAADEFEYVDRHLDEETREDCLRVADLNVQMCEMLSLAFESLFGGDDLREKNLAIRIFEKRIDEIKFDLVRRLRKTEVRSFWDGKALSDFISSVTRVSDIIEDASDYLHMINLRLR
jgi:hypothetical protein